MNKKAIKIGNGNSCPKCSKLMERRKHPENWVAKNPYYFTEWDYCTDCQHVQHYPEFKNREWISVEQIMSEKQRQEDFLKSI